MRKSPRTAVKMMGFTRADSKVMYLRFHSGLTEITAKVEITEVKVDQEPVQWNELPTETKQELLAYLNMGAAFGKLVRLTVIEQE